MGGSLGGGGMWPTLVNGLEDGRGDQTLTAAPAEDCLSAGGRARNPEPSALRRCPPRVLKMIKTQLKNTKNYQNALKIHYIVPERP